MSNEIYHHGIKEMKWGVRRYQNKDGTLTEAGKRRYARDLRDNPLTKEERRNGGRKPNVSKYVKEDYENAKRVVESGSSMVNRLKEANRSLSKSSSKSRMDLSKMTDKEMRERINREYLERQYNDLFNADKISKGREVTTRILEGTGATLGVAASALSIALSIRELRG